MLPAKLGMSVPIQAGEARIVSTAYNIVVMTAITGICELKTEQLLGTNFTHILHDEEDEDPRRDNYRFAKKHPHAAAEHMDRYMDMLGMFYNMHCTLVREIQSLLEEIMESTPTQRCEGDASRPPHTPTSAFSTRDYIAVVDEEEEADPEEREFKPEPEMPSQHSTHV
jgi:hypothetical protein